MIESPYVIGLMGRRLRWIVRDMVIPDIRHRFVYIENWDYMIYDNVTDPQEELLERISRMGKRERLHNANYPLEIDLWNFVSTSTSCIPPGHSTIFLDDVCEQHFTDWTCEGIVYG